MPEVLVNSYTKASTYGVVKQVRQSERGHAVGPAANFLINRLFLLLK
jgi:hypothetical protein